MTIRIGLGACLLLACGGGSGDESRRGTAPRESIGAETSEESADDAQSLDTESRDVAGGETSEFGGDIGSCPEIVSNESLAFDDPRVASWVALAQGHHEQTLGWRRNVLSDAVTGFEEHTGVVIDVTVLRTREVVYGTGGSTQEEFALCDGLSARQLELEMTLATADGAFVATVRDWYEPTPFAEDPRLELGWMNPDRNREAVEFMGSLELGFDPAGGGTPSATIGISFGADGVQGRLSPGLSIRDEAYVPNRSSWEPISGTFPDDPCRGNGTPVDLDDAVEGLADIGGTPRAAFGRVVEAWERAPVPARWAAPFGVELPPEVAVPPATELTLDLGEPTQACLSGGYTLVEAPLSVVTADGRVNTTQPILLELLGGNGAGGSARSPWIAAADFTARAGVADVAFAAGAYGAIDMRAGADFRDEQVSGRLSVFQWAAFVSDQAAHPELVWCGGRNCVVEPER